MQSFPYGISICANTVCHSHVKTVQRNLACCSVTQKISFPVSPFSFSFLFLSKILRIASRVFCLVRQLVVKANSILCFPGKLGILHTTGYIYSTNGIWSPSPEAADTTHHFHLRSTLLGTVRGMFWLLCFHCISDFMDWSEKSALTNNIWFGNGFICKYGSIIPIWQLWVKSTKYVLSIVNIK